MFGSLLAATTGGANTTDKVEVRDAAEHSAKHRTAPTTKNYSTQNVNSVIIEKPSSSSNRLPPDNYTVNSLIPFQTYSNVTFSIKLI